MRTVRVTLIVEVPDDDERTPDEVALSIVNAVDNGSDPESSVYVEVDQDNTPERVE